MSSQRPAYVSWIFTFSLVFMVNGASEVTDMDQVLTEKDILYLPSQWSKRFGPDVIVNKHLEVTSEASKETKENIPHELNIEYGNLQREKFDIFGTDLDNDAPIFVFIHGGYWQEESLTRDLYWYISNNLYKNKIKSIFLGYELCPNVTMPELIDSVNTGLAKCFEYAKENGTKSVYLAGHSAGAHLVANFFTANNIKNVSEVSRGRLKAAFLISGVYDLTPLIDTTVNVPLSLDNELARQLSPQFQRIDAGNTKFYVIGAKEDSPAFVKQTQDFQKKLVADNVTSSLEFYEKDHFNVVEDLIDENYTLTKLIVDEIVNNK